MNGREVGAGSRRRQVASAAVAADARGGAVGGARPSGRQRFIPHARTGRRRDLIGVVAFDAVRYSTTVTMRGVEQAARSAGYGTCVVELDRPDDTGVAEAIGRLACQPVIGTVIIAPLTPAVTASRLHSAVPTVVVGVGTVGQVPVPTVDHALGARLAVEHLLDLGHETVWHLSGPQDWQQARHRADGWRAALVRAGRRIPPIMLGSWGAESGYEAGRLLADRADVTAVFCASDQQAMGMLRALCERRVRVPDDVSVVGYDGVPEGEYLTPSLTTVRQDFDGLGRSCLRTLLATIEQRELPAATGQPWTVPTLIVRASSGPPGVR
ncbi:substrate-binding domain-containing protein [Catellatospora tritici]|uniref:substrate-binding domain-containing protein n=1 Tax=Catellatospora tritici TaxID=2851566 RepID=UPI001C2D8CC7|nr:substrate-binding domain-containing protein [Catellatospora tritici]MBV1856727.1 substrate-binding domain-containing protein [Catellatospora tritici]